jgi:hypothetical protein
MVSGAISWSRGLLRKIEEPMKVFKENKFITSFRVRTMYHRTIDKIFGLYFIFAIFSSGLWSHGEILQQNCDSTCEV